MSQEEDQRIERVAMLICATVLIAMLGCGGFMLAIAYILRGGL